MQTEFFDQAQDANPGQPANSTGQTPKRVFLYDGQVFEDPGPDYSIRQVLEALATTYPELETGVWHRRTLPDGTDEITFVKVTGEKGGQAESEGQQADFFDPAATAGPPLLPGPTAPANKRIFLYDGQIFEDPGSEYTVRDVLDFLARTYPELESGAWHRRSLPDGTDEITFVKITGEKGSQPLAVRPGHDLSPRQLAACLANLEPAELQATGLLERIMTARQDDALSAVLLLELAPEIEAALHQLEQIAQPSQRMLKRCLALKPMPQPGVPLGF
jgi:PRTRC genetic system protein C